MSGSRVIVGLFLIALAVRLVYLYDSSDNPTFHQPIVDAGSYNEMARSVAAGAPIDERFFWQPFFYPAFLSVVYALSGSSILVARVVQAVLGAVTCVLTCCLGERLFDRRAGLLAGLIVAFYGPLIFFETELLATGWAAFWAVVLLLLFLRARATRGAASSLALGVCGVLSVLTRPTFLPFFLAGCVWLLIVLRRDASRWSLPLRNVACAAAGFAAVALPVAVEAYRVTGHFGILPLSGGINFYIGNSPDPCETLTVRPGSEWLELSRQPGRQGAASSSEKEQFYYGQAWNLARTQPLAFLYGFGRKALQFVNSREIPRNVDVYMFSKWSLLLGTLTWKVGRFGFPFGVLLPLALVGAIFCRKRIPLPVWLFVTFYPLSIIVVFVAARYRVPVVPVVSVLAAGGCLAIAEMVRTGRWRRSAGAVTCVAGTVLLATLPGPFCEERLNLEAEMYRGLGWNYYQTGQLDEAIACTSRALELDPQSATAHNNLGMFLRDKQQIDEAAPHFSEALRIEPDHPNAHANLGGIRLMQGRFEQARIQFAEALRLEPDNANTCVLLATVLARQGRLDEAVLYYREALRLRPELEQASKGLAATQARQESIEDAVAECRRALEADPHDADARLKLAMGLDQLGQTAAAVEEYQEVLRGDPKQSQARALLEAASARFAASRNAKQVVETLWRKLKDWQEVARRLREDDALSEPVRRAALSLVLRRTLAERRRAVGSRSTEAQVGDSLPGGRPDLGRRSTKRGSNWEHQQRAAPCSRLAGRCFAGSEPG